MTHAFRHLISTAARSLTLATTSIALSLSFAQQARAQQYGPRIFWLAPSDFNAIQFQLIYQSSNTSFDTNIVYPNLDIDTTALVGSYSHTFAIGDTSGQVAFSLPYASSDIDLSAGARGVSRSAGGLADSYAHLRIGLIGTPALTPQEYVQYMTEENPRVQMYALVGVYLPTGEYSFDRIVNIGSNRWTIRGGIPIVVRLSDNWKPGSRTTFELTPVV